MYVPNLGNLFGQGANEGDAGREWKNFLGLGLLKDLGMAGGWGETPESSAARRNLEAELAAREAARISAEASMRGGMGEVVGANALAANALRTATSSGLSRMGGAYDEATARTAGGGADALGYLASGYGQGAAAMGAGYQGARGAIAGMGPAADAVMRARLGEVSAQGLGAGYRPSPGYDFAKRQAEQSVLAQYAAAGGRGGGNALRALSDAGQAVASADYGAYAQRALQAKGLQVGALANQAARDDALRQAQAQGIAGLLAGGGQAMAGLQGAAGQAMAGQADAYQRALAALSQQYGSQALGASQALGTQQANIYQTTGSNLAAALTGQAQLGASLATGIDRSAIAATAGGPSAAVQGGARDLAQLMMLQYLQGRR